MKRFLIAALLSLLIPAASAQQAGNGPPVPTIQPAPQAPVVSEYNVINFGAACNGTTDDTAAFQAAANAAAGGTFTVPANSRCLINGTITIPAKTTLDCKMPGPVNIPTTINDLPALLIKPNNNGGIIIGGYNVTITHCNIINPTLSYPITTSPTTSWGGIAIYDPGNESAIDLNVTDSTIIGYDTAIYINSGREYINHVYADCTGLNHACIDSEHGNDDMGFILNSKLEPIASQGSPVCTADYRPGTGIRIGDAATNSPGLTDFLDNDNSENFIQTDYDFQTDAMGGTLYSDGMLCSPQPQNYNILVHNGSSIHFGTIISNISNTSIYIDSTSKLQAGILSIYMQNQPGTCLALAGKVQAAIADIASCGTAINYTSGGSTTSSFASFGTLTMNSINNKTAPYITSSIGTLTFGKYGLANFSANEITSDLPNTNLFDTNFQEGIGGEHIDRLMNIPVSISSCGTSPGIVSSTTNSVGSIRPANTTTTCTINFNPAWKTIPNCFIQPAGINPPLPLYIYSLSNTAITVATSTAFNGVDFFSYKCTE